MSKIRAVKLIPDRVRGGLYQVYESRLVQLMDPESIPRHVAIIADGNRRWAREAGFEDVAHGHRVGAKRIADMVGWCSDLGIGTVTVYLLSTENMARASDELDALMEIVPDVVDEIADAPGDWRVRIVGNLDVLPDAVAQRLRNAAARTEDRTEMTVNVAVGYGGRDAVTVAGIDANLYTSGQPDPDLVIRTSGEQRLSGFLLWQSAYSEMWFTDAYWPEFRRVDFLRALRDFAARGRRYGK